MLNDVIEIEKSFKKMTQQKHFSPLVNLLNSWFESWDEYDLIKNKNKKITESNL
jgi:hypothetical protein